jgi:hypothetical protein
MVFDPYNLFVMVVASLFGLFVGAVPGLTATMATALLVPVTFFMAPIPAIAAIVTATAMAIFSGDIPGALLRIPGTPASAAYTDNGAQFHVVAQNVVSNVTYSVTSAVATLTVILDTNPPTLLAAQPLGLSQVQVSFLERISPVTATNLANYNLSGTSGSVAINSATLDASQTNVVLVVAPLSDGSLYTLSVNNLSDQAHAANLIAPNSQVQFVASTYALLSIGNSLPAGSQLPAGNGYNISAGGAAVGELGCPRQPLRYGQVEDRSNLGRGEDQGSILQGRENIESGLVVDAAVDVHAAEIAGEAAARAIQLGIEYDPAPPFDSGSPDKASPAIKSAVIAQGYDKSLSAYRAGLERVARP